jgi:sugar lactone lactonase YvrE
MSSTDREASFLSRVVVLGGLASLAAAVLMPLSAHAQAPQFITQWTVGQDARHITISPTDYLYTSDGNEYSLDGTDIRPRWGIVGEAGISAAPDGSLWSVGAWAVDGFLPPSSPLGEWLLGPHGTSFPDAGGIVVGASRRVYVLQNERGFDVYSNEYYDADRVIIFTAINPFPELHESFEFYTHANGYGIALDGSGLIYVGDSDHNQVVVYSEDGTLLHRWGAPGSGPGQFNLTRGIAVDAGGRIYVVDSGNHRVQILSPEGVYLGEFGSQGTGPGQFINPVDVALDRAGNAYVSDPNRIEKFGTLPTPVNAKTWGSLKAKYR